MAETDIHLGNRSFFRSTVDDKTEDGQTVVRLIAREISHDGRRHQYIGIGENMGEAMADAVDQIKSGLAEDM